MEKTKIVAEFNETSIETNDKRDNAKQFECKFNLILELLSNSSSNGVGSALALARGCDLHSEPVWVRSCGLP